MPHVALNNILPHQNVIKNNIPDNSIVGNNILLIPEEAILKIWQKLVFNQLISVFWEYAMMGQNIIKNNIPDNNIVRNNIFLRSEEAILKMWQMLVFNQLISVFWEILDLVYTDATKQNEKLPCTLSNSLLV